MSMLGTRKPQTYKLGSKQVKKLYQGSREVWSELSTDFLDENEYESSHQKSEGNKKKEKE